MIQTESQTNIQSENPWTDKEGVAAHFGCSVRHISNQMKQRRLPFYRFGRCVRFKIPECEEALRAYRVDNVCVRQETRVRASAA